MKISNRILRDGFIKFRGNASQMARFAGISQSTVVIRWRALGLKRVPRLDRAGQIAGDLERMRSQGRQPPKDEMISFLENACLTHDLIRTMEKPPRDMPRNARIMLQVKRITDLRNGL